MIQFLKVFLFVCVAMQGAKAESQFCGARISYDDQVHLYDLSLDALQEVFQEMNNEESLKVVDELRKRRPKRLHVSGNDLRKARGKIHMSLCYNDNSKYMKCSDIYKQLGSNKKLNESYDQLIAEPIKISGVGIYGKFIALNVEPKNLMLDGKVVTSDLHISLIKIRENDILQKKLTEAISKKVASMTLKLEKASCRADSQYKDYVRGNGRAYRSDSEKKQVL
jgi:hypothetical protein